MARVYIGDDLPDHVEVRFGWFQPSGFRPPVFEIELAPEDGSETIVVQLSGDEIGKLRQVLNHTPQPEEVR